MGQEPEMPPDLNEALGGGFDEAWDTDVVATDPIEFEGYAEALAAARESTGATEAVTCGRTRLEGSDVAIFAVDFRFLGGSMGVAAGERIARGFDRAREARLPVITFLASGGARMQEGMVSLVQMAKTVDAARRHAEAGLVQITVCRHPTTGGMYASFGSRADLLIAEPHATIGFAGPRVAEASLERPLRPGSHTAETALESGQIDHIADTPGAARIAAALMRALTHDPEALPERDTAARGGVAEPSRAVSDVDNWSIVQAARDPKRPSGAALVDLMISDFVRIHGDRATGDDPTIVAGIGRVLGRPVGVIAKDRHAGRWTPTGYRIAQRLARLADRLVVPIVTLIDTPGADASEAAERSGVARAIADTFATLLDVRSPTIAVCIGEGGSGGALALACCDRLLMQETSIFSVIAPEGAAAIMFRDPTRAPEIAARLKLTAPDLVGLGIADAIVPDDATRLAGVLAAEIDAIAPEPEPDRMEQRSRRWRTAGNTFIR